MNTIPKITIHRLTENFVEIDTEQYVEIDSLEIKLDIPKHSVTYVNSLSGRLQLHENQNENIVNSVLAIWGDQPTIEEIQEYDQIV